MTAVQLAAHIRTRRALGLQRTPMRMGVRSSVACIRSRPLCNTRAVPGGPIYKRFPVLCECLSRGRISAVTSGASSAKSSRVHALFSRSCELEGEKKKKEKEETEQRGRRKSEDCPLHQSPLPGYVSSRVRICHRSRWLVAYTFISAVSSSRMT